MKNELAFIPDNISAISGASAHLHPASRYEQNEVNSDATDYFIEEILRPRTDKLLKEKDRTSNIVASVSTNKGLQDMRDMNEYYPSSQFKLKQSLKASRDRQSKFEIFLHQNESIAEKPQLSELNDSGKKSEVSDHYEKTPSKQHKNQPQYEDRVEMLQNQSNQDNTVQNQLHNISNRLTEKGALKEQSEHRFMLPKVDRLSNNQSHTVSFDHSNYIDEKLLKNDLSNHSSKRDNDSHENSRKRQTSNEDKGKKSDVKVSNRAEDLKKSYSNVDKQDSRQRSVQYNKGERNNGIKISAQIQKLGSVDPSFGSMLQTPQKNLEQHRGFYELVEHKRQKNEAEEEDQYRRIAMKITDKLNNQEQSDFPTMSIDDRITRHKQSQKQQQKYQNSVDRSYERQQQKKDTSQAQTPKMRDEQDDVDTEISDWGRDLKIMEHRYSSNIAYLKAQTQELQSYVHFMVLEQQKIDLRKEIIMKQIKNKRLKIQLRNASYTKKFNFISPLKKNNDKPLEYIPIHPVNQATVEYCDELKRRILEEKKVHIIQEERLALLSKYYDILKSRRISDNLDYSTEYQYDSQIGTFSPVKTRNHDDSQCSIAAYCFETPSRRLNKSKSQTGFLRTKATQEKTHKKERIERTPQTVYNLMRTKAEVSKQMLLEYEVYNLGRMKRVKDENRLMRKEIEFVEELIEHFDRSFQQQMKRFQSWAKPRQINYETFQFKDKLGPYTKSPFSRDYHANNKGMNNINIYRADAAYENSSKKHQNKSLSRAKYTISRNSVTDLTLSKKQLKVHTSYNAYKAPNKQQPSSAKNDDYGLFTIGQGPNHTENFQTPKKQQLAINLLRTTTSKKSMNLRDKSLTRFRTEPFLESERSPGKSRKLEVSLTGRFMSPKVKTEKRINE